jgi:HEAT repeat protein
MRAFLSASTRARLPLLLFAVLGSAAEAALPDGRLDYGLEGFEIPTFPLVNQTSPRSVELLADAAAHAPTLAEAVRLVRELAASQLPVATPHLARFLSDQRPQVRAQAAAGLVVLCRSQFGGGKMRDGMAADAELLGRLQRLAADEDALARSAAVEALAVITRGESRQLGEALAKPEDSGVFHRALAHATSASHAAAIASAWPKMEASQRPLAAEALGRCGDSAHASLLQSMLGEGAAHKVAALRAFAGMKAAKHQGDVVRLLSDAVPTVRREALRAMEFVAGGEQRRDAALELMQDPDPTVREAAVSVLRTAITPAALESVVMHLGDEYQPLRQAAIDALSTQPEGELRQAALAIATRLLEDANPRRREDGSLVLGVYRSDTAFEKHLALATPAAEGKPDWKLVAQVMDSLSRIGRPEAKPAVAAVASETKKALASTDAHFHAAVSRALIAAARLGDASVLPDCLTAARASAITAPNDVRTAGIFGIGMLGNAGSAGMMPRILTGEFDSPEARIEAVKAIGNLKAKAQLPALKRENLISRELLVLGHWATQRITGEQTPFEPPLVPWQADISIQDAPPR